MSIYIYIFVKSWKVMEGHGGSCKIMEDNRRCIEGLQFLSKSNSKSEVGTWTWTGLDFKLWTLDLDLGLTISPVLFRHAVYVLSSEMCNLLREQSRVFHFSLLLTKKFDIMKNILNAFVVQMKTSIMTWRMLKEKSGNGFKSGSKILIYSKHDEK